MTVKEKNCKLFADSLKIVPNTVLKEDFMF